ncbi:RrF2 family transcriptional regulator [Streptomyces sp. NPDC048481]|uniref:RrF2 family transcriptional regulator n=1 Tax=Streptomyces sp. NPDC048481 TaxID=3365557 RepID=UPI003717123B
MRLLRSTDLALRVLMRLAVTGDDPAAASTTPRTPATPTTRDVAAAMDVPYTHTAKVVAELQHLGLLEARRGRGGGLALTERGRTASVGAIVRAFEGDGDVVDCEGTTPCPLASGCRLRGALRRAQEAFFASLDPLTLTDIVADPTGPLLLDIARPARTGPPPAGPSTGRAPGSASSGP